jgi:hypothetical protein
MTPVTGRHPYFPLEWRDDIPSFEEVMRITNESFRNSLHGKFDVFARRIDSIYLEPRESRNKKELAVAIVEAVLFLRNLNDEDILKLYDVATIDNHDPDGCGWCSVYDILRDEIIKRMRQADKPQPPDRNATAPE